MSKDFDKNLEFKLEFQVIEKPTQSYMNDTKMFNCSKSISILDRSNKEVVLKQIKKHITDSYKEIVDFFNIKESDLFPVEEAEEIKEESVQELNLE